MSDLQRLKGSERVRKRVSVMFGSDSIEGTQHSLFEVVSNSIDRFRKGHGNYIRIIKHKDLSYTVEDFADGLPMAWNEKEKAYNWDLALKVLYAGDNYNSNSTSIGMNGLGLTSTQYSSEYMEVKSYRDGKEYIVKFKKGRPVDYETEEYICEDDDTLFTKEQGKRVLKILDNTERTGTIIRYKPDLEVFTNTNINIDWINNKIKKQAMVNKGLKIDVIDEVNNNITTHYYENGIHDYIQEISDENNISNIVSFYDSGKGRDRNDKPEYDYTYEIAFAFNNELNTLEYYHNSSELLQGGSTAQAISIGLTSAMHDYLKNKSLYNKGEKIKFTDIEDSLICIISSFSNITSYSNQTKMSIDNKFIKDFTTESIKKNLEIYFIENPLEAEKIAKQVLVNKRSRDKAESERLNLKKKLSISVNNINNRVSGFIDCRSKDVSIREMAIVEGKSAKGAILQGRNSIFQAIYPIRGKILSCLKASPNKIFSNEIVLNIYKLLGCGVELKDKKNKSLSEFDIKKLNYDKIIICTDADLDGLNIRTLLLTMFYVLSPTLLKEGKIYVVEAPLYEIHDKKNTYYAYSDDELSKIITNKNLKNYIVDRNKGLGEMNSEAVAETLMNPETRRLIQIKIDNEEEMHDYFELLMGDEVEPRKKFIYEKFDTYEYII